MKKITLTLFSIALALVGLAQTTATNFNEKDCSGVNHDLYNELDQGHVIVIDWVMPCTSCILPSKTAYNIVQSYATSHPNKVHLYIIDDYANTNCTSLSGWVDNNNMANTIKFSSSLIKMSDYGADGMPKIIVVGGKNRTVYFNENDSEAGNANKMQNAINKAILESSSIKEFSENKQNITLNPNPSDQQAAITFRLNSPSNFKIELLSANGKTIKIINDDLAIGVNETVVSLETDAIAVGFYFIKIQNNDSYKLFKLAVVH